jgi:hypothetical protein
MEPGSFSTSLALVRFSTLGLSVVRYVNYLFSKTLPHRLHNNTEIINLAAQSPTWTSHRCPSLFDFKRTTIFIPRKQTDVRNSIQPLLKSSPMTKRRHINCPGWMIPSCFSINGDGSQSEPSQRYSTSCRQRRDGCLRFRQSHSFGARSPINSGSLFRF